MPFPSMPAVPVDTPDDLLDASLDSDAAIGEGLSEFVPVPDKPFNPKTVTALAQAVAEVAAVMGLEIEPPPYSGPVPELDVDLVRFTAMIMAAAADYGQPLPVGLEELKDDAALTLLTSGLRELAKDEGFAAFLDSPVEDEVEDEEVFQGDPEPDDDEFNFAARI